MDVSPLLAWLRRHWLSLAVGGTVSALGLVVLMTGVGRFPGLSDDEGTYAAQAWASLTQGSLGHYTYWYDHPPLGWLQLAGLTWLLHPGGPAVTGARELMAIPAAASYLLVYLLARRLKIRRPLAALAVVLFAFSPLAVASLRQVFLDNFATPWVLGAFVLAASPRKRLWAFAGSGACLAVATLTKETSLLILPGLVLQLRHGVDRRTRAFCFTAFGCVVVLGALAYPLFALLKGELLPGAGHVSLIDAVRFQLFTRPSTGSALQPGSLSRRLVDGWLAQDPWLPALGVGLAVPALASRRLRAVAVTLLVLVAAALRPGYLPQPFIIAMLPFCAIVAAGALDAMLGLALRGGGTTRRVKLAALAASAVALAAFVVPSWQSSDGYAMSRSADQNSAVPAAERWIDGHLSRRSRVLVDDTFYVDLVKAGFRQRYGVVWFYKLDFTTNLDPSVARHLPQGWRSFDYVVSSDVIRSALAQNPGGLRQVRMALQHSRPVATFGHGASRVEVRRVLGPGSGLVRAGTGRARG